MTKGKTMLHLMFGLCAALSLGGCAVYPDGSLGPLPPAPVAAPPPVAYAPPAYAYAPPAPTYYAPPAYYAPAPVVVAPSIGLGFTWGRGYGWGRGYYGYGRRW